MYTLYYTTRSYTTESTSLVARIALEEIGAAYEVVEVELAPAPPDWYLDINPHGKIPSLVAAGIDFSICDIYLYVMARWNVDVRGRISGEGLELFEQPRAAYGHSTMVESRQSVSRTLACDDIAPITAAAR